MTTNIRTSRIWRRPRLSPTLAGIVALVRVLPRVSRPLTTLLTIFIVVASALPIALVIVSGLVVGSVPAAVAGGMGSDAVRQTLFFLGVAAVLIALEQLLAPFGATMAAVFGRRVDRYLQERTMAAVGRSPSIAHLEDPAVLDLIESARGVGAQGFRPGDAVAALASLVPSWAQALGGGVILLAFHWWIGLAWLVVWPVVLYALQREYLRAGQVGYGQTAALRRADYYRDLALHAEAAKEVRLWGLSDWLIERFDRAWLGAMIPLWQQRRPGRRVIWASSLVVFAANMLTYGLLGWAGLRGELALGALAVFIQATLAVSSFRSSDDTNMVLANAAVAVPRVLALDRMLASPHRTDTTIAPDAPRQNIVLDGVTFHYPGQERPILRGINLDIPAGRSLAIVGANGAGKTTLVKLLCGLYEPTGGRIVVDGTDLHHVDPARWQAHLGAIFQDFARFHLSARDNVAMGAPRNATDLDLLRAAARRAGALDVIEHLPHAWDTILSREYSGGVDLSGGQWQRIALARAMFAVANGATMLVLDEPTANLDIRAEAELYDRFLEMTAGLTTILISHRFSTVRRADHIVVLEDGVVVERGDHDSLIAQNGRYAAMFRVQAERFVEEPV